jgi:hypothetical protein
MLIPIGTILELIFGSDTLHSTKTIRRFCCGRMIISVLLTLLGISEPPFVALDSPNS